MDHGLIGLAVSGVLAAHFEGEPQRIQQVLARLLERGALRDDAGDLDDPGDDPGPILLVNRRDAH